MASNVGTKSRRTAEPPVVRTPAVKQRSLTAIGTPERAQIAAAGDLALRLLGGGEGALGAQGVVGVQAWLERLDARQHRLRQRDR